MYCEDELILLVKTEFCGLLYLVTAIHSFDSRFVVNRTQEMVPLEGDKDLSFLKYPYVFYARSSRRRKPTHAVEGQRLTPQYHLVLAVLFIAGLITCKSQ